MRPIDPLCKGKRALRRNFRTPVRDAWLNDAPRWPLVFLQKLSISSRGFTFCCRRRRRATLHVRPGRPAISDSCRSASASAAAAWPFNPGEGGLVPRALDANGDLESGEVDTRARCWLRGELRLHRVVELPLRRSAVPAPSRARAGSEPQVLVLRDAVGDNEGPGELAERRLLAGRCAGSASAPCSRPRRSLAISIADDGAWSTVRSTLPLSVSTICRSETPWPVSARRSCCDPRASRSPRRPQQRLRRDAVEPQVGRRRRPPRRCHRASAPARGRRRAARPRA